MGANVASTWLGRCVAGTVASLLAVAPGCRTPPPFSPAAASSELPAAEFTASPSHGARPTIELSRYVAPAAPGPGPAGSEALFRGPALVDGAELTLDEALRVALQHSEIARTLEDEDVSLATATSYDASIAGEAVNAALAAFDTNFESTFSWNRFDGPPDSFFGPGIDREERWDQATFTAGLTRRWHQGTQTRLAYNPSPGYLFFPNGADGFNPSHVSALELEVRQPLLAGGGALVNSTPITVAQLTTDQSAWEFKAALLDLVRSVEQAYWELHAARAALEVLQKQEPLISEVVRVEEANIAAERAVGADVAKARTQQHRIRQRSIEARRVIREKELQLGSLIGLAPHEHVSLVPVSEPPKVPVVLDRNVAIARALDHQPRLVQRRIGARIRELELNVAENGYLPSLELQALYRANGLEDDLGTSLQMMASQEFHDWQFGAAFSVPLGRNASRARLRAKELELARQSALLREEVRLTVFEITEILVRIDALYAEYRAAVERDEEAQEWLRGARIRYENPPPAGRSENWLLAALDDLLFALQASSEAAEEAAFLLADYNTELARLQQAEGTLLARFNVRLQDDPWSDKLVEQLPSIEVPTAKEDPRGGAEDPEAEDTEAQTGPVTVPESAARLPRLPATTENRDLLNSDARRDDLRHPSTRRLPQLPRTTVHALGVRPIPPARSAIESIQAGRRLPSVER